MLKINEVMTNSKADKLIIQKLFSNNVKDVLFTIKGLRNTGNVEIIPQLIKLLNQNNDTNVKNDLIHFFNDLKFQEAAGEIIKALKDDNLKNTHQTLLSSCWQSGLDYSSYTNVFIDKFISGTYLEAIESFTVIENFEGKIGGELVEDSIKKLKSEINSVEADKKELLVELVHVLERM